MFERKVYTPEFKRKAVRLTKERGNIAATARDLGLSDNTLQGWKSQLDKTSNNPFPVPSQGVPRDAELAQLQRENARLKEENEMDVPDLHRRDFYGATPLHWAAIADKRMNRKLLWCLEKLGDVVIGVRRRGGYLSRAPEIVPLLLDQGAHVNARDLHEATPLHWAVQHGRKGIVQLLLARGADIEACAEDGTTPLHWAASAGHGEIVTVLLEHGADIQALNEDGGGALDAAVQSGSMKVVRILLDHGADINASPPDRNFTPLYQAAGHNHVEIVRLLLERGARVDGVPTNADAEDDDYSPLHHAARWGSIAVAAMLLEHGADINAGAGTTGTPLIWAFDQFASPEMVRLLIGGGANVHAVNADGDTALHFAVRFCDTDHRAFRAFQALLDSGAVVEARNKAGETPLLNAVRSYRNIRFGRRLLECGASPVTPTEEGITPLSVAEMIGEPWLDLLRQISTP